MKKIILLKIIMVLFLFNCNRSEFILKEIYLYSDGFEFELNSVNDFRTDTDGLGGVEISKQDGSTMLINHFFTYEEKQRIIFNKTNDQIIIRTILLKPLDEELNRKLIFQTDTIYHFQITIAGSPYNFLRGKFIIKRTNASAEKQEDIFFQNDMSEYQIAIIEVEYIPYDTFFKLI